MDQVHLHLISNHVPIIGAFFGALVLAIGMARKSPPTLAAAYIVFLLSAVCGLVAYFTGGGAAGAVKDLPEVSRPLIREHAEMATYTLWTFIVLAVLSLIGLIRSRNHYDKIKRMAVIILVVSLIGLGISVYTGLIGGQIRHTEVRDAKMQKHAEEEHPDNDK